MIAVGAIQQLGNRVAAMGGKRAFLVTDRGVSGAGITQKVSDVLTGAGIEVVLFEDVQANPTFTAVKQGIEKIGGALEGTVVVSLGGGSSMDAAKAMAVIAPDGGSDDIASYCMNPGMFHLFLYHIAHPYPPLRICSLRPGHHGHGQWLVSLLWPSPQIMMSTLSDVMY